MKIGNARRGSRDLLAPPALVLTLMGNTLTWSPRDPQAADWVTNIYDLSGHLLDNSGSIEAGHAARTSLTCGIRRRFKSPSRRRMPTG